MPLLTADSFDGLVTDSHDFGFEVETFPLAAASSTAILTTGGSVFGVALNVRRTFTASNLVASITTAGATLTANSNWGLLFNSAGTLIGQSADQSTAWTSTGLITMALTAKSTGSLTLAPGLYWAAVVGTGTTLPVFAKSGAPVSLYNAGVSAALSRTGVLATSVTTAPGNITPSSITQSTGLPYWFGLV